MNLPEEFTRRMKLLLEPEDFKAFIESYSDDKSYGLRINPLKIESQETLPFFLSPVPWAKEGFYAVPEEKPGRHALHEARRKTRAQSNGWNPVLLVTGTKCNGCCRTSRRA